MVVMVLSVQESMESEPLVEAFGRVGVEVRGVMVIFEGIGLSVELSTRGVEGCIMRPSVMVSLFCISGAGAAARRDGVEGVDESAFCGGESPEALWLPATDDERPLSLASRLLRILSASDCGLSLMMANRVYEVPSVGRGWMVLQRWGKVVQFSANDMMCGVWESKGGGRGGERAGKSNRN
jgi:hypothetical protein